jgi:hypothetical protein
MYSDTVNKSRATVRRTRSIRDIRFRCMSEIVHGGTMAADVGNRICGYQPGASSDNMSLRVRLPRLCSSK